MPGRFLTRLEKPETWWHEIPKKEAYNKIKQALREKKSKRIKCRNKACSQSPVPSSSNVGSEVMKRKVDEAFLSFDDSSENGCSYNSKDERYRNGGEYSPLSVVDMLNTSSSSFVQKNLIDDSFLTAKSFAPIAQNSVPYIPQETSRFSAYCRFEEMDAYFVSSGLTQPGQIFDDLTRGDSDLIPTTSTDGSLFDD